MKNMSVTPLSGYSLLQVFACVGNVKPNMSERRIYVMLCYVMCSLEIIFLRAAFVKGVSVVAAVSSTAGLSNWSGTGWRSFYQ